MSPVCPAGSGGQAGPCEEGGAGLLREDPAEDQEEAAQRHVPEPGGRGRHVLQRPRCQGGDTAAGHRAHHHQTTSRTQHFNQNVLIHL